MPLTNEIAFDLLAVYFECMQNATIAARMYAIRYPDRRRYTKRVFVRLARRLRNSGSVHRPILPRRGRARTEANVINVLAYIEYNPHANTRGISQDLGITRTTVQRIIKDHRLHPYHVFLHQALTMQDFDKRLDYCYWLLNMVAENPRLMSNILWTDEATFKSDGQVNLHNMHYWSRNNPHWMQEVQHQGRWSVNVWCGVLGGMNIGAFIFDQPLTGEIYLHFLTNHLPLLLENVPLETRRNMFFQHDGCPAHYSAMVRQFLDRTYPNRWIGRGSLFPWPARSPDLTCLDFYLWGRLKDMVYLSKPTTRENMVERIRNAINRISMAEVETAALSTHSRLQLCIAQDGRHFEHLRRH